MEFLSKNKKMAKQLNKDFSDKQAVRNHMSHQFDHEFANEPLSTEERLNNKKTKKRQ
ncbi:small acid-soluble spore protein O [Pallidibacillus pasinlerensis]